jgi:hypothetical protein
MRKRIPALTLAAAVAVLGLPSTAGAASVPTLPRCAPMPSNAMPVQVTAADNGAKVCLVRGQHLSVALSVDPRQYPDPANWWSGVTRSGPALTRLPNNRLPVRGATLAEFRAVHRGTSTLTSTWNICPAHTTHACGAPLRLWRITVIVTKY